MGLALLRGFCCVPTIYGKYGYILEFPCQETGSKNVISKIMTDCVVYMFMNKR